MSVRRISVLVAIAAAALVAAPGGTAAPGETTGARLSVFPAFQTFPANEPFYVKHGWGITPQKPVSDVPGNPQAVATGRATFALSVDGVPVDATFVDRYADVDDPLYPGIPLLLWRFWVFDFPAGMTGTHTFTGTWSSPCAQAVTADPAIVCTGPPSEPVVVLTRTTVVTFTP